MGLFDNLRGKQTSKELDVREAVIMPAVTAMLADGKMDDDEIQEIVLMCEQSPIFSSDRDENIDTIIRVIRLVQDEGEAVMCQKAGESLSPALRETAFAMAVKIVFSDGYVGRDEEKVVDFLAETLNIAESDAKMIVKVISILQHPVDA